MYKPTIAVYWLLLAWLHAVCRSREKRLTKIEWNVGLGNGGRGRTFASQQARDAWTREGEGEPRQPDTSTKMHQCTQGSQGSLVMRVQSQAAAAAAPL